jgi:CRP-like cAMP-binding protein
MARRDASFSAFDMWQWLPAPVRAAFLGECRPVRIGKGSIIYSQGEEGDSMFRVVSGSVRLSVAHPDGRELLYLLFQPGDCFGSSSCVDSGPRPQTAEAAGPVELQMLPKAGFDRLRAQHPPFEDALLRLMSRHMRLLSELFAGAHLNDLSARVAGRILSMSRSFGQPVANGIELPLHLPQAELAAMVGGTRQSVNRVLHDLKRAGILDVRQSRITIRSPARLMDAANDRIGITVS